ncbi:MAG TPA: bifunctional (p)ppGpp synthetase/guanosine-3',5'-bis(diphosphate) 3'-pyrophosphohydrolase [Rhodospirillaceae bacterium]|jgi:guanosine-3',5'-bis(diphosphate) 3'-pyrophosphohydrolase|nr:bifunctional (p)ppGpp synthetase/guanosine-3',5'-bis(diphosphate) 3'-pyrophosphohydrolase [Alphaproteobacteria bacterium]HBH26209.1 bifunctional (p)ppGpp synthetase/guanosine-3',5'-bis(diphosphate) 3'-pyrophosphohydrolase [Rhodospirillaceae bacterium]
MNAQAAIAGELPTEAVPLVTLMRSYQPTADPAPVERACVAARAWHEGQTRASGEPYYTHPIAVATILAGMRMDQGSIITAVLHDVLEDTPATYEDLKKAFGKEVADLVNGVSKLTQIESRTAEGRQAENFRKLLLAMSEDIRVLLVKLADRLHNMRTLAAFAKPEKRRRIAAETLEIYVPLAERIGIHQVKTELEDLAFAELNPEARESIARRLAFLRQEGTVVVGHIIEHIRALLAEHGIKAEVMGREKSGYSIWKKMQRKNVSFEQLSDIMAFRVIVADVPTCYNVLGLIHGRYHSVPGRFKDYISTPKPNGYRSIHTTVMGPAKQRVEIQIRTPAMHREAELGVAAHWAYKDGATPSTQDAKKYRWLRELLEILEQEQRPEDFLENTKLELFQDQVFAFTPRGDLIELPSGATPIDFAYAIHSDIGNRCVGARINGRIAPLNTTLSNGDQVDIVTAKVGAPSPNWERFVVTGKARSHIRRYIRSQQRGEYIALGRAMLQKVFRAEGYDFTEKAVVGVVAHFKAEEVEDIYARVGAGLLMAREVFRAIFPAHAFKVPIKPAGGVPADAVLVRPTSPTDRPVPIKGLIPGMAVHFARCCHPLPGDRIVGIVTTGKGVTIHTIDCETLETFADTPERWLDVAWAEGPDAPEVHIGRIAVTIANEPGTLGTLSSVIGKSGGNITNLKITNRSQDFWEMTLDVYVNDTKHLKDIIAALRATPCIASVERTKGR